MNSTPRRPAIARNKCTPLRALLVCALCLLAGQVHAVRSIAWDRTAISLHLVVGVEQMLHFPSDGDVGLPPTLANPDIFRTLFTGNTAYWRALQAFQNERIKVRLASGEFILFDVTATVAQKPPARQEALNIVVDGHQTTAAQATPDSGITVFELIRYAVQNTYAPARLVAAVPGVAPAPLGLTGALNTLYQRGEHPGLVLLPQHSWRAQGLWVTSLRVINRHSHPITLDNRRVQPNRRTPGNGVERHFIASLFYQRQLPPGGKTTLFVVTDAPFPSVIQR